MNNNLNKNKNRKKLSEMLPLYSQYRCIKDAIAESKGKIKYYEHQVKVTDNYKTKSEILQQLNMETNRKIRLENQLSDIKKTAGKLLSLITLVSIGATTLYAQVSNNNEFKATMIHADHDYSYSDTAEGIPTVAGEQEKYMKELSYISFKNDVTRFVELSKKEELNSSEKEEFKNLRLRIKSSPENISRLSLELLKQKIANSLGITDWNAITLADNSTSFVGASYEQYPAGDLTDITFSYRKVAFARYEQFVGTDGKKKITQDTIPENALAAFSKLNKASDPLEALQIILSLPDTLEFPPEVQKNIADMLHSTGFNYPSQNGNEDLGIEFG